METRTTTVERSQAGEIRRVTWIGLTMNVVLSVFKLVAGILGNSQAVTADAIHSLSDMSTDVAILVGVQYWNEPADSHHPYGHGKAESVVAKIIALILIVLGFKVAYY